MAVALSHVTESPPSRVPDATVSEIFLMALGSLVLLVVEVLMNRPRILFGRYLWIDELWTKLIESQPSVWQSLLALKHSGDPTPPVYHLLARASWGLIGGSGETAPRALAFVSMWIALVLLYALLRRSFAVLPALVAVLSFWSSIAIIEYAFYARPYAALLAATVGFCLIYGADKKGFGATALTAALAALICTLHYFGVFALAAVVLGDTLARREALSAMIRRWSPAAAGPIAVACCWPLVHAWKTGQTVFSYLPPQTLGSAVQDVVLSWGGAFEATTVLIFACAISAAAGLASRLLRRRGEARTPNIGPLQPVAGLLGLMLVPIFVAIFSAVALPTMTTRYMIPGLLGVTGLLAVIASYTSPRVIVGTAMLLVLLGAFNLRRYSNLRLRWQTNEDQMMNIGKSDQLAIVTFNPHEAYLLYAYAPSLRSRVFIADLSTTHKAELSRCVLLDYDLEKKWSTIYPDLPKLVDLDQLRRMGKFHLVDSEAPILAEQENRSEISLPLQKVAQILSLQNVGDLYEVRPN
jgi:hypothetical protein